MRIPEAPVRAALPRPVPPLHRDRQGLPVVLQRLAIVPQRGMRNPPLPRSSGATVGQKISATDTERERGGVEVVRRDQSRRTTLSVRQLLRMVHVCNGQAGARQAALPATAPLISQALAHAEPRRACCSVAFAFF